MKKRHKQYFKLILLIIWPVMLFIIGLQFCSRPSGFSTAKISSNFVFRDALIQNPPTSAEFTKIEDILHQKFYYFDSGTHCYIFISEDQKYVIKFFKMRRLTPKYWLNYLPLPWLEKLRFEKIQRRERLRQETFESFKSAFEDFKEETGLLFVHLNKTKYLHDKATFVDKVGEEHLVSLNKVPFVLQKKAQMIVPYISDLIDQGQAPRALEALTSVLRLIKDRCQKGYVHKDGGVSNNYGFIDGKAVEVDIGRIIKDESIKDPINYLREVLRVSKKIEIWLQATYPELCAEFQEEVQRILSNEDVTRL